MNTANTRVATESFAAVRLASSASPKSTNPTISPVAEQYARSSKKKY